MFDANSLHAAFVELAAFPSAKVYRCNNGWACGVSPGKDGPYIEARGKTPVEAIRKALAAHQPEEPLEGQLPLFEETR